MKANRWLCLLLAICLIFTLTACSGGGGGSDDDNNDADTWPVEFYRSTVGSSVSAMRVAPATGSYKYIYFYENGTYKSGDLNNGTLTQTGSGTYTGGDPHGSVTLSLTGTYEGNAISGKTVVISSSSLTIDGQTFARSDSNTTPDGGGGQSVISGPWLCFTSTGESTVSMIKNFPYHTVISLEYSKNGEPWKDFVIDTTTVYLADGDKVYLRGDNISFSDNTGNYVKFVMTGPGAIAASGNVMSLVDKTCASTTIPNDSCFCYLFENCSIMTTAPELPAIVLKSRCYINMFMGCTSLTAAPELPAQSLTVGCYTGMFDGCSKLTAAPDLPATNLADSCYEVMFHGCTNLSTAPALLPATDLADFCYHGMFQDCSKLTTAPELPATNLAEFCYYSMFQGCSKLTTAPELPATSLPNYCYIEMFKGCSKLNYIKVRFTDWNVGGSTEEWVVGVAASGDFYCPKPGDPLGLNIEYGGSYIPTGWDVDDVNNP